MASGLRKFWSQLWVSVLFQPSSHLTQEEWVRAKSHTDVQMFAVNEQRQQKGTGRRELMG